MDIVDITQVKAHLNMDHDEDDTMLGDMITQSSAIIFDYLKRPESEFMPPSPLLQAASLIMIAAMYRNRDGDKDLPEPLSQPVRDLLHRLRDPALA